MGSTPEHSIVPHPDPSDEEPACGKPYSGPDLESPSVVMWPCSREPGHGGQHYYQPELVAF